MITKQHYEKLKSIKCVIFDVDGVLTDGRILWASKNNIFRSYNVRDGYGLITLRKRGFYVAIISASEGPSVEERIAHFGIENVFFGDFDKASAFKKLSEKLNLDPAHMMFMGDDLFDIPVLKACGFSATVSNAVTQVKKVVDYISPLKGGEGAAREMTDILTCILDKKTYEEYCEEHNFV